jgi:tRNA nucleotidyltransferase (CCA-adding enzyme)
MFGAMLKSTNKMRQKAMYVDVIAETKEIINPLKMDEKEVNAILEVSVLLSKMMKDLIEETSEEEKEKWRKAFGSLPREVWVTGEIPIEWFKKEK